ncbi:MAG: cytochrome c oxidase subunit 3, partial [Myxococcota bacterium]
IHGGEGNLGAEGVPEFTAEQFKYRGGDPDLAASGEEATPIPCPDNTNMFFTLYFAMTGLHGIHVLVGVFVFGWLFIRAWKGHFTPDYYGPIDYGALYWHLVDLIWIFLFPLFYLI